MQVDYDFVETIMDLANQLAAQAIKATYEEDIVIHSKRWNTMYDQFETIIQECNHHMKKIGNI